MLIPQLRGYTPLRVGNQQLNISHQIALSIFALLAISVVGWHFFNPTLDLSPKTTVQSTTSTLFSVAGKKVLPRHWTLTDSAPQGTKGWKKPAKLRKIVGLVFYGRPASVSILDCYLKVREEVEHNVGDLADNVTAQSCVAWWNAG